VVLPGSLCVPEDPAVAERGARAQTLEDLVRQLLEYQIALSEEETRWSEERDHLERTRDLLEKAKSRLQTRVEVEEADLTRLRQERGDLDGQVSRNHSALAAVRGAARESGARLLKAYHGLPSALAATLDSASSKLRARVAAEGVAEAVQAVTAFVADLQRLQTSAHAVEEIVEVGEEGRREMDVLYLGSALGYYVASDGQTAGLLERDGDSWKATPRDGELAERVRLALEVYRKKVPAQLVELPIVPGSGEALRAGGER
jgi:chromosome segregation ATPase